MTFPQSIKFTLIGASLVLASACATAQPPQGGQQGQPPSVEELFAHMDADQDGLLSSSEVKGPLQKDFDQVDTDGDGYLSKEEIENAPKPQGRPPKN